MKHVALSATGLPYTPTKAQSGRMSGGASTEGLNIIQSWSQHKEIHPASIRSIECPLHSSSEKPGVP